jgi:hypothetical protein
MSEKPKEERLKEGLEILRKLKEVGVAPTDPGFAEIQAAISDWVATGRPSHQRIPLSRQERVADLLLPRRAMNIAQCVLKTLS